jgi:hypothetical protein
MLTATLFMLLCVPSGVLISCCLVSRQDLEAPTAELPTVLDSAHQYHWQIMEEEHRSFINRIAVITISQNGMNTNRS